ncbi:MAG: amidohydrolase family protein, partial [Planctomycetota bacterium]
PIEDGIVEVNDGRIVSVGYRAGAADSATIDLGNVALLPALVNAHAHLEFADLDQPIQPAAPFTEWIRNLMSRRRERTRSWDELVFEGMREAALSGTGLIGEIATGDWSADVLATDRLSTAGNADCDTATLIAFRELIGLRPEQVGEQLALAERHIVECRDACERGSRIVPGLSPHAPYSVSRQLFQGAVELARREDVPLCIHLAETPAELELLDQGTGEFTEMLKRLELWRDDLFERDSRPLDYLRPLETLDHALIAHGNYLSSDEVDWLGSHSNVATVFCPRTHAFFGHAAHPWRDLLDAGANVCLGTDGRSSNPDYSLWLELKFLASQTSSSHRSELLSMATLRGAQALGQADHFGSLAAGKRVDFCVVDLDHAGTNQTLQAITD